VAVIGKLLRNLVDPNQHPFLQTALYRLTCYFEQIGQLDPTLMGTTQAS